MLQPTAGSLQQPASAVRNKIKIRRGRGGGKHKINHVDSSICDEKFSIMLINIRSYYPRSDSLEAIVEKVKPSVILLNEVNLPKNIKPNIA